MSTPTPRPPQRAARSQAAARRYQRRSIVLTLIATILAIIAAGVAIFTATAITNPEIAQGFFGTPGPTATLFVMNPTATTDPRGTFPPTWTASPTLHPANTSTPSATSTLTSTPTITSTVAPTLTFTPINTVPVGWYEFRSKETKLAIQFTATWTALTLKGRDPSNALKQITEDNPVLEASLVDGLGNSRLEDLILVAFDSATNTDPYIVNITIAYAPIEENATAETLRDSHLDIYGSNDFYSVISTDQTTVDGKHAQRIRYTSKFTSETGEEMLIYHQEVIAPQRRKSDPLLIITLSTSDARRNIYEALLDRIVTGIRYMR